MQLIEAIYMFFTKSLYNLAYFSILYLDQKKIVSAFLVFTISISFFFNTWPIFISWNVLSHFIFIF